MAMARVKTELSPVEMLIVERTLGRQLGQTDAMARIARLTAERQALYTQNAAHPFQAKTNSARIRVIGAEIEQLWIEVRRQRAMRRVRIEAALNIADIDEGTEHGTIEQPGAFGAA